MKCAVADCDGLAKKRIWCIKHYMRWYRYRDPLMVRPHQRPDPSTRSHRRRFTMAMWARLLDLQSGPDLQDPQFRYLSAGIADFRRRLAEKEPV